MSDQLSTLISDRTYKVGEQTVILSKPKWGQIAIFAGIVEGLLAWWQVTEEDEDETAFISNLLKDSAQETRSGIEQILEICLRKNDFGAGGFKAYVAEFEYDFIFALLLEIFEMNKQFFFETLAKVGIEPISQDGETSPKP